MTLQQLRYFISVVENAGFTAAARECRVAQPSLSQQIIKLEEEIGHPLFERDRRNVRLTDAGHHLMPRAKRMLREYNDALNFFSRDYAEEAGHLAIGAIPTIAPYVMPNTVRQFMEAFPKSTIVMRENLTDDLLSALEKGELDLCLLSPPFKTMNLIIETLYDDEFVVAVNRDSPLADREALRLDDLKGEPFILLEEMHCLGSQIGELCHRFRLHQHLICRTSQLSTIQEFVAQGIGISILPKMAASADKSGKVVYQRLKEKNARRTIVAAIPPQRRESILVRAFLECLKSNVVS